MRSFKIITHTSTTHTCVEWNALSETGLDDKFNSLGFSVIYQNILFHTINNIDWVTIFATIEWFNDVILKKIETETTVWKSLQQQKPEGNGDCWSCVSETIYYMVCTLRLWPSELFNRGKLKYSHICLKSFLKGFEKLLIFHTQHAHKLYIYTSS